MPKQSKVLLRGSKPGAPPPTKNDVGVYVCSRCGQIFKRQKQNFSPSQSPLYMGNGGYLTTCVTCVDDLYQHYKEVFDDGELAMRRVCMKFDVYWNPRVYGLVPKQSTTHSRFRQYISKLNLQSWIGKTFDDTLDEEAQQEADAASEAALAAAEAAMAYTGAESYAATLNRQLMTSSMSAASDIATDEPVTIDNSNLVLDPSIIKFWGSGYTPDYYYRFQERYDYWTADKPKPLDQGAEALYKQICILEDTINRDVMAGKPVEKSISALNNLLGSLNEKPVQKKQEEALDTDFEQMPFGVGIKLCEDTRPIPKPDPAFEDVDGIVRYISIWFLGHLCKMLNIRNTYCKLYEDEIERLRVERPDLAEEDDESFINDIFGDDAS